MLSFFLFFSCRLFTSFPFFSHAYTWTGLPIDALLSYSKFLCGIIGSNQVAASTSGDTYPNEDEKRDELLWSSSSTIDALLSIAKNTRLSSRGTIAAGTLAALVRITVFSNDTGKTRALTTTLGKRKENIKKTLFENFPKEVSETMIDFMNLVETAAPFPANFVNICSQRLLVMLADFGGQTVDQVNKPISSGITVNIVIIIINNNVCLYIHLFLSYVDGDRHDFLMNKAGLNFIDISIQVVKHLIDSKMAIGRDMTVEDELSAYPLEEDLKTIIVLRELTREEINKEASITKKAAFRLADSLYSLLGHALFQVLTSVSGSESEIPVHTLPQLVKATHMMLVTEYPDKFEHIEENEDDPSALSLLFDSCMELLSVSINHSVKGVRDSIKKVWAVAGGISEIDLDVIDEALETVIGDDGEDHDREEEEEDEEEDVDQECLLDGGEDDDEESIAQDGEYDEEGEQNEIVIDSSKLLDMLETDMDDEEEAGRSLYLSLCLSLYLYI